MFINEELFNSWVAEAVERQTKINSFVHSIDADIKVNISAYDDFYCIISDKLINVSLNSDPYTDQLLDGFIQNRFGVSMNPFLLGTLHEIGHIITFDKNLDRDRDILYYMLQGLALLPFSATAMIHPEKMNGLYFFTSNSFVLTAVSILSTPFLLIFSLLLSISNITLIKKEGKRLSNLLGIILSFLLLSGVAIIIIMFFKSVLFDYLTITPKKMAINLTRGIISSIFVYFECNLLATLFLARRAGRHKPKYDKDFIIILGCGIREDGTLYPLLRGRADRAINFYKEQLEKTGKKAVFIPSGGQGPDEIMPEGEAIKRYLIEQGIPEEQIMAETRSLNTLQNMQFSKEIIDSNSSDANIAFSTTNYHVFRGGMLASSVGMNADGMGAKTKWYFWPNALIREFVGMLVKERKIHIFLLIIIVTQAIIMGNIQLLLNLL